MNFYAYCKGNPLTFADPYGLCPNGYTTDDPLLNFFNSLTGFDNWVNFWDTGNPSELDKAIFKELSLYSGGVAVGIIRNYLKNLFSQGGKDKWGRPETLEDHFNRHGKDFGANNADDYAQQAAEFFKNKGAQTKIDSCGVIRKYDPKTNTFGAYNPDGTIRTFYKPKRGNNYWNDQPGKLLY
jgi:hypothetical protein